MSRCAVIDTCPFFNDKLEISTVLADVIKKSYCLDRFSECARLKVLLARGADAVPDDLFPDMQETADDILSS